MDWTEHRRTMLRHCLWMAGISPAYALSAARLYEDQSCGVLEGLAQKVHDAIEKRKTHPPTTEEERDHV